MQSLIRLTATILLVCFGVSTVSAAPRKRERFEVAVEQAIAYLAKSQNPDGSWNSGGGFGGGANRDPAVTGLCVMALLSAGHVPGEEPYGTNIERGVRYVCSQQQANGAFAVNNFGNSVMYTHGICTLMIAEVVGLMPDRREADALRKRLENAVKLLRHAQTKGGFNDGGWRYSINPGDADISVTAWQVMALRAAKNVGCDVPAETVERAIGYIKNCYDFQTGGYRYVRNGNLTVPCTAASILSLELCGKDYHKSPESLRAASYITSALAGRNRDQFPGGGFRMIQSNHFFYGVYYTSQAMFQIGGEYWTWYREYLHSLLIDQQQSGQQPGGFWRGVSGDDNMAGVNYSTSMAVLALTVEYRFLPIYQRSEEPEERSK